MFSKPLTKAEEYWARIKSFTLHSGYWTQIVNLPQFTRLRLLKDIKKDLHPDLDKNDPELLNLYGILLKYNKDFEESIEYLQYVAQEIPEEGYFFNFVDALVQYGDAERLWKCLELNTGKATLFDHWLTLFAGIYLSEDDRERKLIINFFDTEIFKQSQTINNFLDSQVSGIMEDLKKVPVYQKNLLFALKQLKTIDFSQKPAEITADLLLWIAGLNLTVTVENEDTRVSELIQTCKRHSDYFKGITLPEEFDEDDDKAIDEAISSPQIRSLLTQLNDAL